jgi:hypothetical protein
MIKQKDHAIFQKLSNQKLGCMIHVRLYKNDSSLKMSLSTSSSHKNEIFSPKELSSS